MQYMPSEIAAIRDAAAVALRPAFDYSHANTVEQYLDAVEQDRAQLWRAGDAWAITEVCRLKQGTGIHIVALAGKFTMDLMRDIETWGKSKGCTRSYFSGRKGWIRRLPDYALASVTCAKDL